MHGDAQPCLDAPAHLGKLKALKLIHLAAVAEQHAQLSVRLGRPYCKVCSRQMEPFSLAPVEWISAPEIVSPATLMVLTGTSRVGIANHTELRVILQALFGDDDDFLTPTRCWLNDTELRKGNICCHISGVSGTAVLQESVQSHAAADLATRLGVAKAAQ